MTHYFMTFAKVSTYVKKPSFSIFTACKIFLFRSFLPKRYLEKKFLILASYKT